MEVSFSSSFKSSFKKRIKGNKILEERFWHKLEQFISNPFDASLKTHKLSGKLRALGSFSVDFDERVLFYFTEDEKAVFVDIGSHDQVYRKKSVLGAPLLYSDMALGVLTLIYSQPNYCGADRVELIRRLYDQMALLIENARLYAQQSLI